MKPLYNIILKLHLDVILGVMLEGLLGASLAKYLNKNMYFPTLVIGLAWIFCLILGTVLLFEYFNRSEKAIKYEFDALKGESSHKLNSGQALLLSALTTFAVLASLTVLIISTLKPDPPVIVLIIITIACSILLSSPFMRRLFPGYWEIVCALVIGFFLPLFCFSLQGAGLQTVFTLATFPVFLIIIALIILLELERYAYNVQHDHLNLVAMIGWRQAMDMHNILIISAYVFLGMTLFIGLPRMAVLGALISLPAGLLQMWQIWRIREGSRVKWSPLITTAKITYFLMAYLLSLGLWIY